MLTINGESYKKYRLSIVAIRIILMGIPAVITAVLEFLFDKSEDLLLWLDYVLPNPLKEKYDEWVNNINTDCFMAYDYI